MKTNLSLNLAAPIAYAVVFATTVLQPAAAKEAWESVSLSPETLATQRAQTIDYRSIGGRNAVCLNGEAFVKGLTLKEGSLSVDVLNRHHRHFAYLTFRAADQDTFESAYIRMHKSGQDDALQYTPIFNRETNWQLFQDQQANARLGDSDWLNLRVDFKGQQAHVTLSADGDVLGEINTRLSLGTDHGGFGLATLFEGCFSNMKLSRTIPNLPPLEDQLADQMQSKHSQVLEWALSKSFELSRFDGMKAALNPTGNWQAVQNEKNGRLMISRYRKKAKAGQYRNNSFDGVFAGTRIYADKSRDAILKIDASDKATVFLNGKTIYAFDNTFRAKGSLFRGDFNRHSQMLNLALKEGRNDLIILVAERANGWGLAGEIADKSGLVFQPVK